MLQQKVWVNAKASLLYPNLYIWLVGPPSTGKSEACKAIAQYLPTKEDGFYLASKSCSGASLSIEMAEAAVKIQRSTHFHEELNYNSMLMAADELQTLMHEYSTSIVAMLTTFYDCNLFTESRVTREKIEIEHPQLSTLVGTTTSHLLKTLPEGAWEQGLMSRTILIFADEKHLADDIFASTHSFSKDLANDMGCINTLFGQFRVDDGYRNTYNTWRKGGSLPAPAHPRLKHYCGRRGAHLLKLSMVAAVDEGDNLVLTESHFHRALGWLTGAEAVMPYIFSHITSVQTMAIEEALEGMAGKTVTEGQLGFFLSGRIPAGQVPYTINLMASMGRIVCIHADQLRLRTFKVLKAGPLSS